jgi:acyl transferase domain-containing protein/acyl carrier protein
MSDALTQLIATLSAEKRAILFERLRPPVEPIAIVGMSCRFPGGVETPEQYWDLLQRGGDAIIDVPAERWDSYAFYDPSPDTPGKMYVRHGGFLRNLPAFDAHFFGISPREARRMDPQQRLLLEVTWEALERSGQRVEALAGSRTGVFVGIIASQYDQLQASRGDASYMDDPYFSLGSSSSVASGRIAFLLDLQGPNMAIDTACSSSLVALHLACQSLRSGETTMALVGGVNAITLPETMVNACKMRMLSPDGVCKTFDARADGFVAGEGCGVVVLKRLSDAQANNDPILAIIRGSAVNEDGRSTNLTAPNGLAQQAVLRQALADARLTPHAISYVEAHGSGTALGDPIEVEALGAVYGTGRPADQPLPIGAVKTNIGHLAAAAGIAGLMKTVLMLQHGQIPPTLNLREPNPHIAWNEVGCAVPTTLTPWTAQKEPRRAGVSAFGWAGTNAHVILEEAPAATAQSAQTAPGWHLLPLSAKTTTALDKLTQRLAAHLRQHPTIELTDVAMTLQSGRNSFNQRRAVICRDREDALSALEQRDAGRVVDGSPHGSAAVALMFPGLGDNYLAMGQDLYQHEPIFRKHVDQCCELLTPIIGRDLREMLYQQRDQPEAAATPAQPPRIDLRQLLGRAKADQPIHELQRTIWAQPALFVIEYALAQLMMAWGVRPQALIGYSLGEYVAACIAGVFSLEDALKVVACRARMIEELPAGAMLAVVLPEAEVRSLLHAEGTTDLNIAAVNGPALTVVAGPTESISRLEQRLPGQGIACRRLPTTHAFHSTMMEPLQAALIDLVNSVTLHSPTIPYLSNVTGTWITADQATDPAYWSQHLCNAVRFGDGLAALQRKGIHVLLEVGPGQTLSSIAAQQATPEQVICSTLPTAQDGRSDREGVLRALGQLWTSGVSIDWEQLHAGQTRRRVALPTYPFEHQYYWLDSAAPIRPKTATAAKTGKQALKDWFYAPAWKQSLATVAQPKTTESQCWLLFLDETGIGQRVAEQLQAAAHTVVTVVAGSGFERLPTGYSIDPRQPADYQALLSHLQRINQTPDQIVHLWSVDPPAWRETAVDRAQTYGFDSLLFLAQALGMQATPRPAQISVISNNMHTVIGEDGLVPESALVLGPCIVIPNEYPHLACRSIDLGLTGAASRTLDQTSALALQELLSAPKDQIVAYRGGRRWVRGFEPVPLEQSQAGQALLRPDGVYLITGGLGGIGLAMARAVAATTRARLVLVGRSGLPERDEWPRWLADHPSDDPTSRRIREVQSLEALGSDVLIETGDVADPSAMTALVSRVHRHFGRINGVIHAAGVPGEGLIQRKTSAKAAEVLRPKVQGTLALEQALQDESLDFWALFSSSNAVIGGLGEVDYCSANAFLDVWAHARAGRSRTRIVSIDWGPWQWDAWQGGLLSALPDVSAQIEQFRREYGIGFEEGAEALFRILGTSMPQVMVITEELQATIERWQQLFSISALDVQSMGPQHTSLHPRPNLREPYVAPRTEDEQRLAAIWQEMLGVEQPGVNDSFFELGGNSLIGMMLITRIQNSFGVQLNAASLYEAPSISALCALLRPEAPSSVIEDFSSDRGKQRRARFARKATREE